MRYRIHNGELIPAHLIPRQPVARSSLPAPMIIRDQMDAMIHPATGLWADSKSAFRSMTKDSGCVELGNDAPSQGSAPTYDAPPAEQDVKQAMDQLGYG